MLCKSATARKLLRFAWQNDCRIAGASLYRIDAKQHFGASVGACLLVATTGYAGLAAATELVLRGHEVTLIEGRALLGGRAHSFVDPKSGVVLDNGQHVLMGCYRETLDLLKQLGVMDRLFSPPSMQVPFFSEEGRSVLAATARAPCRSAPRAVFWWSSGPVRVRAGTRA